MPRYIDADALIVERTIFMQDEEGFDVSVVLVSDIKLAPTADVEEVKHGEWIPIVIQESYYDPPYCDTCKCSLCGYEIDVSETVYNYCPNCGAKMDGKGDSE